LYYLYKADDQRVRVLASYWAQINGGRAQQHHVQTTYVNIVIFEPISTFLSAKSHHYTSSISDGDFLAQQTKLMEQRLAAKAASQNASNIG
jgi:hypothetical protein